MPVIVFGEGMIELSAVRDGAARVAYGGDALNTAIYLARENIDVEFVSALGDDSFSRELCLAWAGEGLQLGRCLICAGGKPGIYAISVDEQGERSFTYWRLESAARRFFGLPGAPAAIAFMKQAPLFYCSGITLSIFDDAGRGEILGIMDAVRANGGDVAFDINYRPKGWPAGPAAARDAINSALERASVCFSSAEDWTLLYGPAAPEAIAAVLRAKGCREAIVKDGPRGCFLSTAQTTQWIAPEAVVNPVDTTGAGDSFNAGYLAARRRGAAPPEACRAGNNLARKVILQPGAIAPSDETPIA